MILIAFAGCIILSIMAAVITGMLLGGVMALLVAGAGLAASIACVMTMRNG